jgi:hypothetical protein
LNQNAFNQGGHFMFLSNYGIVKLVKEKDSREIQSHSKEANENMYDEE